MFSGPISDLVYVTICGFCDVNFSSLSLFSLFHCFVQAAAVAQSTAVKKPDPLVKGKRERKRERESSALITTLSVLIGFEREDEDLMKQRRANEVVCCPFFSFLHRNSVCIQQIHMPFLSLPFSTDRMFLLQEAKGENEIFAPVSMGKTSTILHLDIEMR